MGDTREDQEDRAMMETAGVSSFSELLMLSGGVLSSSDHHLNDIGADGGEDSFGFVFSGSTGSRMLCFSGDCQNDDESLFLQPSLPSGVSVSDPSCTTNICKNSNDACADNKSTKSSTVSLVLLHISLNIVLKNLVLFTKKKKEALVLHSCMQIIRIFSVRI